MEAPHTRTGEQQQSPDSYWVWHTTRVRPWTKKARQRRRNKLAKASRKANR